MATVTREVKIANPAGRPGRGVRMAKRMSLKQRLHFGSKAQRAAAKRAIKGARGKKRSTAKRSQRVRSHRVRTQTRRRNIGEIVVATLPAMNPAKRRNSSMAKTKTRRHKQNAGRRRNAAVSRKRAVKHMTHRRRKNPGQVAGWIKGGAAVVGGAVLSKVGTQAVLGSKNTGVMGYAGNAAATALLGYAAHLAFRDKAISQAVVAGGVAQIIVRVIGDYSLLGSYSSKLGLGDYQVSNFWNPQRVLNAYTNASPAFPGAALPAPAMAPTGAAATASMLY